MEDPMVMTDSIRSRIILLSESDFFWWESGLDGFYAP
jgi:hypothetical protein